MERGRQAPARLSFTIGELAAVVGGRCQGDEGIRVDGFSIDSRSVRRGQLFIAIRGDRFDGHDFVAQAIARGACGAVVGSGGGDGQWPGVVVDDTLCALQELGRHVRRASRARVVAVTGSVGKTTTKELAAAVLESKYDVYKTRGNLNNHIGLPLSLLELTTCPDVGVVELGMNAPGEISRLVEIAEPDVRVWTNVAEVHAEFFASVEAIADAKAEILERATPDTHLVANADDPLIMRRVGDFRGTVTTFGIRGPADVTVTEVEDRGLDGSRATIRTPVGTTPVSTTLLGSGNLANVLAAVGVALRFQIPLSAIRDRVETVQALPHRGRLRRLGRGILVVDDTYNASPVAVQAALETLARDRRPGRRVAVLGEMLELGSRALPLHRETGRVAARADLALLLAVGGEPAAALAGAAVEAGMGSERVVHAEDSDSAAAALMARLEDGDVVLVKGSRGVRTDQIVSRLEAECG